MDRAALTVGVTGVTGYVGRHLAAWLGAQGVRVVGFERPGHPVHEVQPTIIWELGQPVEPARLAEFDLLVHLAYDYRPRRLDESVRVNARGTADLIDAAQAAGVREQVVISSLSAYPGCRSRYGQTKLALEAEAGRRGVRVVRPGLIWGGDAGLVTTMARLVRRLPLVPVFAGGRQVLYLVHYADLGEYLMQVARGAAGEVVPPFVFACPEPWTMRRILASLAAAQRRPGRLLSVPWRPVYGAMAALESVGLTLPFRSDSLRSLMYQDPAADLAPQAALGLTLRDFDPLAEPHLR